MDTRISFDKNIKGHSSGQTSHTSRKFQSERNPLVGTCEQLDTVQGHPDKGTGHRSDDYHLYGNWFDIGE
jgi:hypothetical protein